jgi:hypothetical protein
MNRKNVKFVLLILFMSIGLTVGLLKLDALMDNACRGADWCSDCNYVCLEGEIIQSYVWGGICDGPGWCKTYIFVRCWDEDADAPYAGWCVCLAHADSWECGSQL